MPNHHPDKRSVAASTGAPLVCIAIPVYNGAAFIEGAVRSALGQRYPRLRVLVADNVSTDATREVLTSMQDPRLECRFFAEHVPVAESFGRALAHADGDYVLLLAADNALAPDAVSTLVAALQANPGCGLAYGRVSVESEGHGHRFMGQALRAPVAGVVEDLERRILDDGYNVPLDGVLFRRGLPGLRMDPEAAGACDLDLMLRLGRAGISAVGVDTPVAMIREHAGALSEKREAMWREALEVYDRLRLGSRHAERYARRMGRLLTWLIIYLLQRTERDSARSYLRRYAAAIGRLRSALLATLIAVPALAAAPLTARRLLLWRSRRALS